ncbi:MAG: hypothetical protein ACJAYP_001465 [Flavobacterium sp.]|jgi:hypothetical protein
MKLYLSIVSLIIFSSFITNIQEESLVFRDKDQVIKLELNTQKKYLVMHQSTEIKVSVEKIDLKKSSIIGKGVCLTGEEDKNYFVVSITVDDENVFNNQYSLTINYPTGKSKKLKNHKFIIPVRKE